MNQLEALEARFEAARGNVDYIRARAEVLSLEDEGKIEIPKPYRSILLRNQEGLLYCIRRHPKKKGLVYSKIDEDDSNKFSKNGGDPVKYGEDLFLFTIQGKAILVTLYQDIRDRNKKVINQFVGGELKEDKIDRIYRPLTPDEQKNCIAHVVLDSKSKDEKAWINPQAIQGDFLYQNVEHIISALKQAGGKLLSDKKELAVGDWVFFRASEAYVKDLEKQGMVSNKNKVGVYIHAAYCIRVDPLLFSTKNGEKELEESSLGEILKEYKLSESDVEYYSTKGLKTFRVGEEKTKTKKELRACSGI